MEVQFRKLVGHVHYTFGPSSMSTRLLQLAIPLVKTHGFTREALSLSVLSLPTPHAQPLSDTAISSLWGQGDDARRTLITAWQDDARQQMNNVQSPTMREILHARLECNEPVLSYLPEVSLLHEHSVAFCITSLLSRPLLYLHLLHRAYRLLICDLV